MHLTARELDIMAVLWDRESGTVAEVLADLLWRDPGDVEHVQVLRLTP